MAYTCFFTAIVLNFLFIVFKFQLPSWLINFYYSEIYVEALSGLGLTDQRSVLELARPRGLFPNPNGSAFLVNIISLFIFLCYRNKVIKLPIYWQCLNNLCPNNPFNSPCIKRRIYSFCTFRISAYF